jgi:hypothetical protein
VQRQPRGEPVHEAPVVVVRAGLGRAQRPPLVRLDGEGIPEQQRHQQQRRHHAPEVPRRPHPDRERQVHRRHHGVLHQELPQMPPVDPAVALEPPQPLVGHGQRAQGDLPEPAGPHEVVGVAVGIVGERVVQRVGLAEVRVGHHHRQQRQPSPPEVASPPAPEVPVAALVGHHRPQKHQIGAQHDVQPPEQRVARDPQERAQRRRNEHHDERPREPERALSFGRQVTHGFGRSQLQCQRPDFPAGSPAPPSGRPPDGSRAQAPSKSERSPPNFTRTHVLRRAIFTLRRKVSGASLERGPSPVDVKGHEAGGKADR